MYESKGVWKISREPVNVCFGDELIHGVVRLQPPLGMLPPIGMIDSFCPSIEEENGASEGGIHESQAYKNTVIHGVAGHSNTVSIRSFENVVNLGISEQIIGFLR